MNSSFILNPLGKRVLYAMLLCAVAGISASAQVMDRNVKDSRSPLIDRFSFKTNALEWLLTIPNAGVEFDLSPSAFNRMSIGVSAKYNWNTYHRYVPSTVFNMFDVRPEFRYYYRTRQRPVYRYRTHRYIDRAVTGPDGAVDSVQLDKYDHEWERYRESIDGRGFSGWFRDEVWTLERSNPKPQRAQYIGAYADYGSFSLKFGQKGISGQSIGLGASYGWGMPLYEYNRGAVDIEFGFSVGLMVTEYDVFTHNPDGNYYTKIVQESRGLHMVPFPVVSELRVAFAWRPVSIKDKFQKEDPQKKAYNDALDDIDRAFRDMVGQFNSSPGRNMERYAGNDSLYRADYIAFVENVRDDYKDRTIGMDIRLSDKGKEKLKGAVDSRCRQAFREFSRYARAAARENRRTDHAVQVSGDGASGGRPVKERKKSKGPEKEINGEHTGL